MLMAKIGVDPDCVELARKFLAAAYTVETPSEKRVAAEICSLSEVIQTTIDDWFFAHPEDWFDAQNWKTPDA
jgi:hypothetical protein